MLKREQMALAMRVVPSWTVVMFVASAIIMNLLANKSIELDMPYLALDCGIVVSWCAFFSMDVITKRFGAKAAITVSIVAALVNVLVAFVFYVISFIPGMWGMSYEVADSATSNFVLDSTFQGNWFILFGSVVAMLVSAIVNALLNVTIAKLFKRHDTFVEFVSRSYVSTFIGQVVDNLTFAFIVSIALFGWTIPQCIGCAIFGACFELIGEVVFSPLGYKITRRWAKDGVGEEYIEKYGNDE